MLSAEKRCGCRPDFEHTVVISSIKQGFDHLPHALTQPGFRLDLCENGQMVCLSLCNYFDADDRDWLFACGLMSVHSVSQDTHTREQTHAGVVKS